MRRGAAAASLSAVNQPAQPGPPGRRVVIAEDEALIRMDLAEMLGEEGYDVVGQAGDGARAVELAEELRPDLVILDVKMPVLDGIAAAERIAGQRIAPVVILTAFSQRELVERARDAGAMAYLVKPFSKSRPGAGHRDGGEPVRRARRARAARSPTSPSGWRPARRSTGPRACSRASSGSPSPRRSAGSRRPRWTCASRCARWPRASSTHGPGLGGRPWASDWPEPAKVTNRQRPRPLRSMWFQRVRMSDTSPAVPMFRTRDVRSLPSEPEAP